MAVRSTSSINAYVGTETGILKSVSFPNTVSNHDGLLNASKNREICEIYRENENRLLVGRRNGTVQRVKIESQQSVEIEEPVIVKDNVAVRGLFTTSNKIVACLEDGFLQIRSDDAVVTEKSCGSDISKMKVHPEELNYFATGGEENDLKLWDVENLNEPIFRAKNVRNDFLNLRVPVCVTNIDFLSPEVRTVITATKYSKVKIYDTKAQRRPLQSYTFSEHPITAIAVSPDKNYVTLGNSAGYMGILDLRTGREVGRYKGIAGSIRVIQYHADQPYIVECGLDRFVRIYDIKTRMLASKMYLKSQLTALSITKSKIVLSSEQTEEKEGKSDDLKRKNEQPGSADEDSDVWDEMPVIQDAPQKKKRSKKVKNV